MPISQQEIHSDRPGEYHSVNVTILYMSEPILLPQRIFRMIRDGDFADHGAFQKAAREIFERYGF
jgi:hypothetical protein